MYTLYFKKHKNEIKITKAKKVFENLNFTEEATQYNDCYFICLSRRPLKEKAESIKQEWIYEAREHLRKVENIKI